MPAQIEEVPASAEQLQADAARAKEYSRKKVRATTCFARCESLRRVSDCRLAAQMAQHRAQQVDLGVKLRLRMAALEALPEARPHVCRVLAPR